MSARFGDAPHSASPGRAPRSLTTSLVLLLCGAGTVAATATAAPTQVSLRSPGKAVELELTLPGDGRLHYAVTLAGQAVLESSPHGHPRRWQRSRPRVESGSRRTLLSGRALPLARRAFDGAGALQRRARRADPRGHRNDLDVDVRVFDDAAAFRFVVPGNGTRVPDAASAFQLPAAAPSGITARATTTRACTCAGELGRRPRRRLGCPAADLSAPGRRRVRSDHRGRALRLRGHDAAGRRQRRLRRAARARCAGEPPYTLRYGEENAKRLAAPGPVVGHDHDALARRAGGPGPRTPSSTATRSRASIRRRIRALFPQGIRTGWLRPGRAVWRYLDGPSIEKGPDETPEQHDRRVLRGDQGLLAAGRRAGLRAPGRRRPVAEALRRAAARAGRRTRRSAASRSGSGCTAATSSDAEERRRLFARLHGAGRGAGSRSTSSTTRRRRRSTSTGRSSGTRPSSSSWSTSTGPTSPPARRARGRTR